MPLTKRQFELRIDDEVESLMRSIYEQVGRHRELAYSQYELEEILVGEHVSSHQRRKIQQALEALTRISALDKRDIGGTDYYAFLQGFNTDSWERKFDHV
ncbi:MAG: hypothetical protein FJ316_02735 [SAR202 cluster bacterium]|nr:hypothetical protein [SAR202 cluster bacterium]